MEQTIDVLAYKSEGVWLNAVCLGEKTAIMLPDRAQDVGRILQSGARNLDADAYRIAEWLIEQIGDAGVQAQVGDALMKKAVFADICQRNQAIPEDVRRCSIVLN